MLFSGWIWAIRKIEDQCVSCILDYLSTIVPQENCHCINEYWIVLPDFLMIRYLGSYGSWIYHIDNADTIILWVRKKAKFRLNLGHKWPENALLPYHLKNYLEITWNHPLIKGYPSLLIRFQRDNYMIKISCHWINWQTSYMMHVIIINW